MNCGKIESFIDLKYIKRVLDENKHKKKLEKIDERSEISSKSFGKRERNEDLVNVSKKSQNLSITIAKPLASQEPTDFFKDFLCSLLKNKNIYKHLINSFFDHEILKSSPKKTCRKSNTVKRTQRTYKITSSSSSDSDSGDIQGAHKSLSTRKTVFTKHSLFPRKPIESPKNFLEVLKSEQSSETSSIRNKTPVNRFRVFHKHLSIKPDNPALLSIFKTISEDRSKITSEDLRRYLGLRYPGLICDAIVRYFHIKPMNYDEFVKEINKFISSGEEKHLAFCFEIFDFNKDKIIDYKDTFTAMEIRNGNYYDSDLVLIKEMFIIKKERKVNNPVYNALMHRKSIISHKEKTKQIEIKPANVGITQREFMTIRFNGRPQIFLDFLMYISDYNFLVEKGYSQPSPPHSAKNSENIIVEMNLNPEFNEKLSKMDMYDYYCALDNAMGLFSKPQREDFLKKFKYLQSDDQLKYKVITKESMIKKLVKNMQPGLFGYSNEYFSTRIYEYLSEGKNLTKPAFLYKASLLYNKINSYTANRLSFDIIDSKNDNKLTVDEIYNMFEALPIASAVYNEFYKYYPLRIVDMFIQSIFEKVRDVLNFIDFQQFSELLPNCLIGLEVLELFNHPFEDLIGRKTLYFEPNSYKTRPSIKFF